MDKDPCTLKTLSPLEARDCEAGMLRTNKVLDHLVEVAGDHHKNSICPVFCVGQHFVSDSQQLMITDGLEQFYELLYTACMRLAGIDTD